MIRLERTTYIHFHKILSEILELDTHYDEEP